MFAKKITPSKLALVKHHIMALNALMMLIIANLVTSPAYMKLEESANVIATSMAHVPHLGKESNALLRGTVVRKASRLFPGGAVERAIVIVARTILVNVRHITKVLHAMLKGTIARMATGPRTIMKI